MAILMKEELSNKLYAFYVEHYGERDTDEWFEQPAVNVWIFKRDGKFICLKAHILSGEIEESIEEN